MGANIVAARKYLEFRKDLNPSFARTQEEALERIAQDVVYYLAICDVNFPNRTGEQPIENGPNVAEILDGKNIPFLYLISRKQGNVSPATIYLHEEARKSGKAFYYAGNSPEWIDFYEWGNPYATKDNPIAWAKAIKTLEEECPCEMIYRARLRTRGVLK